MQKVSLSALFMLDGDGNRHAEPVLASYLRTASCRVAHDPGALGIAHIYEMPTNRPSALVLNRGIIQQQLMASSFMRTDQVGYSGLFS